MVKTFGAESLPVRPVPFSVTVALPPLLIIEIVALGIVPVGISEMIIVKDFLGAMLKALLAEKVNSGSVGFEIVPVRLPSLPVFAMTSFAVDDAVTPIPTGLNVNDGATLSFDPLGIGVGEGVADETCVGVGVADATCVGVGVGVAVPVGAEVAVGVVVYVAVGVAVEVAVPVGVGEGVGVSVVVGVAVGVIVEVGVPVGVGEAVGVMVAVGVEDGVGLAGTSSGVASTNAPRPWVPAKITPALFCSRSKTGTAGIPELKTAQLLPLSVL
jgi:hypothetical protein